MLSYSEKKHCIRSSFNRIMWGIGDVGASEEGTLENETKGKAGVQVPFMITRQMKLQLIELGYNVDAVNSMTPAEAHKILRKEPYENIHKENGDGINIEVTEKDTNKFELIDIKVVDKMASSLQTHENIDYLEEVNGSQTDTVVAKSVVAFDKSPESLETIKR